METPWNWNCVILCGKARISSTTQNQNDHLVLTEKSFRPSILYQDGWKETRQETKPNWR